ncbi:MAG TPA: hypothetical protein PKW76_06715 [bacterium]|nr:hypothetical protein [bacterium]HOX84630.1 hypothetical protein [bacterium]HPG45353.1 hypothetical protein [bacterium]HPM96871.1 hypothetical protein [bacterium]
MQNLIQRSVLGVGLIVLLIADAFSGPAKRSVDFFPTTNGIAYAAFDLHKNSVTCFQPHLVDFWDVGQRTIDQVDEIGFELVVEEKRLRIASLPLEQIAYVNGTGIIRIDRQIRDLKLREYVWSPMILDYPALIMVLHIPHTPRLRISKEQIQAYLFPSSDDLMMVRCSSNQSNGLWVAIVVVYTRNLSSETTAELQKELSRALPDKLLEAEERWWMHWHGADHSSPSIYGKSFEVLRQSAAFLKMAQCREPGPSFGQIVSHLSVRQPKVAAPRDMAYAAVALAELGHYLEAKGALQFMLGSNAGFYRQKKVQGKPWGMNSDYQISVHHYAGMGYERSEMVNGYPLLHFDGHGLFLWALQNYIKTSSDAAFGQQSWPQVREKVILPLIDLIDETGLIQNDSGLTDKSAPGEHFSYTSCAVYNGLNQAAVQARSLGDVKLSDLCVRSAVQVRNNILSKMLAGKAGVIKKSMESEAFPMFLDGSAVEAINWQIVYPQWKSAKSTLDALHTFLRVGEQGRGFALAYTDAQTLGHESLFVDLRAFHALRSCGKRKHADEMLAWVIERVSQNGEMVPEYFSRDLADYIGPYPLIGLGAAPLILAILAR